MNVLESLEELGLAEGEAQVYLHLWKHRNVKVSEIASHTRLHRTTIYDFLEKLMTKGLASYTIQNNVRHYSPTQPEKLFDFIREKEGIIEAILPHLQQEEKSNNVHVEVYKGKEGIKTILNDILRTGKDYVIMGIDEALFQKYLGQFMEWFFEKEKQAGFNERILTRDAPELTYESPNVHYKYLPKESFNPTPTYIWGDNVAILIWQPLTVIRIQHKELADSYLKYFEILWKMASTKPRN